MTMLGITKEEAINLVQEAINTEISEGRRHHHTYVALALTLGALEEPEGIEELKEPHIHNIKCLVADFSADHTTRDHI